MKKISISIALGFLIVSRSVFAADPINTGFFSSTAVQGYDTVAYFTQDTAVEGSKEYSFEYMGADWLFSSAENQALFAANPEKYAPQYGGYCAYAVSQGYTASIEPEQVSIVDDKLYLNYNADVRAKWMEDKPGYIQRADTNWPELKD